MDIRFTPYIVFGVTVLVGGIIPLISIDLPLADTRTHRPGHALCDSVFFTALAGMDIGTAFGGMGSSREMTIASWPAGNAHGGFTVSLAANSTSLTHMVQVMAHGHFMLRPSLAFALLAFIMVHHRNRAGPGR